MKKKYSSILTFFSVLSAFLFVGIANLTAQVSFVDPATAKIKLKTEVENLSKKINLEYPEAVRERDFYDIARMYYLGNVLVDIDRGKDIYFAIKSNLSEPLNLPVTKSINVVYPTSSPVDFKMIYEPSQIDDDAKYVLFKTAMKILAN